jgi:hypothetical protein
VNDVQTLRQMVESLQQQLQETEHRLRCAESELEFYDTAVVGLVSMVGQLEGLDPLTNPQVILRALSEMCNSEYALLLTHYVDDEFRVITCSPPDSRFAKAATVVSPWLAEACRQRERRGRTYADYCDEVAQVDPSLYDCGIDRLSVVTYRISDELRCLAMCNRRTPVADPGGPDEQYYRTPEGAMLRVVISLFPL